MLFFLSWQVCFKKIEANKEDCTCTGVSLAWSCMTDCTFLCSSCHGTLRFLPKLGYQYAEGNLGRNGCNQSINGEVLHCETCKFDLCPSCARTTSPGISESEFPAAKVLSASSSISTKDMQYSSSLPGTPLLCCFNCSTSSEILKSAPYQDRYVQFYWCNPCLKPGQWRGSKSLRFV